MSYTVSKLSYNDVWHVTTGPDRQYIARTTSEGSAERICQAFNVLDSLELHGHKPEQIDDLFSELASLRKFTAEARDTLEMVRLANRALERIIGEGGLR